MTKNRSPYKEIKWFQKVRTFFNGAWIYVLAAFGLAFAALLISIIKPIVIKWRVEEEIRFTKGTDTYNKLVNITVPVFFNFRVFNITNPDALKSGEKFKFVELGPYVYEEKRIKNVTEENPEEGTLSYIETKTFKFRPDLSNGTEEDRVNAINFVYLSACSISRRYLGSLSNSLLDLLDYMGEDMIMRDVSIIELIFQGAEIHPAYEALIELNPSGKHRQFVDGTFAYFNRENNSNFGEFKIMNGVKETSSFGQIVTWNGETELSMWKNDSIPAEENYCTRFNGSDGSLNPPFMTKDRIVYFFDVHLCRAMPMDFREEISYHGIPGWQFRITEGAFQSPEKNPANQCFWKKQPIGLNNETIDGLYRNFDCYNGSPLVISKPHFLDGDPSLVEAVEGLEPNRLKHDSYYEVEPISGIFLQTSMKFQLVAELQAYEGFHSLENLPHVYVPLLWIEQVSYLDEENVNFMHGLLVTPLKIVFWAQSLLLIFSGLFVLLSMYTVAKNNPPKEIDATNDLCKIQAELISTASPSD